MLRKIRSLVSNSEDFFGIYDNALSKKECEILINKFEKSDKVKRGLTTNGYDPKSHMSSELWETVNLIKGGHFSQGDKELFRPLIDNLLNHDPFCVMADFSDYCDAQDRVSSAWTDRERWNRMSLINTARSGFFSSDRSIKDYCKNIWGI